MSKNANSNMTNAEVKVPASITTTSATSAPALNQLPAGYLANGYFDATGYPDVRYIREWAEEIAKKLAPMDPRLLEELYRYITYGRLSLPNQLLGINKIVSLAAYLVKQGKAPALLLEFCKANAAAVKTIIDCANFRHHMEAIYYYMD